MNLDMLTIIQANLLTIALILVIISIVLVIDDFADRSRARRRERDHASVQAMNSRRDTGTRGAATTRNRAGHV